MSDQLKIDVDITRVVDAWAAAIGTPGHAAASADLDTLLVDLTAARAFRDRVLKNGDAS